MLTLVGAGFSKHEILYEMPVMQVRRFFQLTLEQTHRQLIHQAGAMRMAYHADEKEYSTFSKDV